MVETVTTGRAKRSTAGNRMRELLEKAHKENEEDALFAEDENDDEFEAPQEQKDVFLDEFADTDEELEEDEDEETTLRKEERRKAKSKAVFNPLVKAPRIADWSTLKPKDSDLALLDPNLDVTKMAPSTLILQIRKQRREQKRQQRSETRRSNLRASTLKTEQDLLEKEQAEKAALASSRKGRKAQHETGEVRGARPMTQDELIAAALEEEERNKEALTDWLRKEEERRELRRVGRKRVRGPRWTWVSRTVGKLVEVVGEENAPGGGGTEPPGEGSHAKVAEVSQLAPHSVAPGQPAVTSSNEMPPDGTPAAQEPDLTSGAVDEGGKSAAKAVDDESSKPPDATAPELATAPKAAIASTDSAPGTATAPDAPGTRAPDGNAPASAADGVQSTAVVVDNTPAPSGTMAEALAPAPSVNIAESSAPVGTNAPAPAVAAAGASSSIEKGEASATDDQSAKIPVSAEAVKEDRDGSATAAADARALDHSSPGTGTDAKITMDAPKDGDTAVPDGSATGGSKTATTTVAAPSTSDDKAGESSSAAPAAPAARDTPTPGPATAVAPTTPSAPAASGPSDPTAPPDATEAPTGPYTRNYLILSQIPGGLESELALILGNHVDWSDVKVIPARNRPVNRRPPVDPMCGLPAKYRHPASMVPYASVEGYKTIEGVLGGQYVWSEAGFWAGGEADAAADGVEEIAGWKEAMCRGWLGGKPVPKEEVVPEVPEEVQVEEVEPEAEEEVEEVEVKVEKAKPRPRKSAGRSTKKNSRKRKASSAVEDDEEAEPEPEPEPEPERARPKKKAKSSSKRRR